MCALCLPEGIQAFPASWLSPRCTPSCFRLAVIHRHGLDIVEQSTSLLSQHQQQQREVPVLFSLDLSQQQQAPL